MTVRVEAKPGMCRTTSKRCRKAATHDVVHPQFTYNIPMCEEHATEFANQCIRSGFIHTTIVRLAQ